MEHASGYYPPRMNSVSLRMKVRLEISYAGETLAWEGLEFEDEAKWEEILNDLAENCAVSAYNEETGEKILP
jgi:hypothetical protein